MGRRHLWLPAAVTGWLWLVAVTFYFRFRQGKWRSLRVNEGGAAEGAADEAVEAVAAGAK